MLSGFSHGYRAAIFGASGGIGGALAARLAADPRAGAVYAGSRRQSPASGKTVGFAFDLEDESSISAAFERIGADGPLDLIIVATGVLHAQGLQPEKTYRALSGDAFARAFAINATGPALIAKHGCDRLARDRRAVFAALSARVGSISDNRTGGWHAYRASKAALNQIIACLALELGRRNQLALALALHPGTVATGLSEPFRPAIGSTRLFTPEESARNLLRVIDAAPKEASGRLLAWDGGEITP
jgi:NAD(P)-dependent dehydrogenase (short-subunit alcohol dehydrogenase family)